MNNLKASDVSQPEILVSFMLDSLAPDGGVDKNAIKRAQEICQQCFHILKRLSKEQISSGGESSKTLTKVSPHLPSFSNLSHDGLFAVCEFLDGHSKARLRFTSMRMHLDMLGCPLDLIEVFRPGTRIGDSDFSSNPPSMLKIAQLYSPLKLFKRSTDDCECSAAQQLYLMNSETAEFSRTRCSNLNDSELSSLGIGRSWLVTGFYVLCDDKCQDAIDLCNLMFANNIHTSFKRLEYQLSVSNLNMIPALYSHEIGRSLEDLTIVAFGDVSVPLHLTMDLLLPFFPSLRWFTMRDVRCLQGSLEAFAVFCPLLETLSLRLSSITGNMFCLPRLKNLTQLEIVPHTIDLCGDVSSLSTLTKLTHLNLQFGGITGEVSALSTLTKLERLTLADTEVTGDIESLLSQLKVLRTLHLENNPCLTGELKLVETVEEVTISDGNMHLCMESLINLSRLTYCNFYDLPNLKGNIAVLASLSLLRHIEIENCSQVCGCIQSIALLPSLKVACLKGLPHITGKFTQFTRACDSSATVAVYDCEGII